MTLLFQFYISDFTRRLHIGSDDLMELDEAKKLGRALQEDEVTGVRELTDIQEEFNQDLEFMLRDFNYIFYLSVPYFLFPIHYLMRVFFELRTKRFEASRMTLVHYCELGCFITLVFWEIEKQRLSTEPVHELDLVDAYPKDKQMIVTIIRNV